MSAVAHQTLYVRRMNGDGEVLSMALTTIHVWTKPHKKNVTYDVLVRVNTPIITHFCYHLARGVAYGLRIRSGCLFLVTAGLANQMQ